MTITYRFKFDKLVRDKIKDIMRLMNIGVFTRTINNDEYIKSLKDKMLEEAQELSEARSIQTVSEELADLSEVMVSICEAYGITIADVQQLAAQKRADKGGFNDRLYITSIEISADNPALQYYKTRQKQYPEIK